MERFVFIRVVCPQYAESDPNHAHEHTHESVIVPVSHAERRMRIGYFCKCGLKINAVLLNGTYP
jgi:hypothetical protein